MNTGKQEASCILKRLRLKSVNKIIIGHLNINSFGSKIEAFKKIVGKNIDIIVITETKLDGNYTTAQLMIDGYCEPFRKDRNKHGGGTLIYVRKDIHTMPTS